VFFCALAAQAQNEASEVSQAAVPKIINTQRQFDWGFALYGASAIKGPLQNVINFRLPSFDSGALMTLSLTKTIKSFEDFMQLELDLTLGKSLESSGPYQMNPNFVIRFMKLPWDRFLQSSFAIGNGVSYATSFARLEVADGVRQRLLYFISLEFAFAFPSQKRLDILLRVHHRSGMFGAFGSASGGVNYLGLGLRHLI